MRKQAAWNLQATLVSMVQVKALVELGVAPGRPRKESRGTMKIEDLLKLAREDYQNQETVSEALGSRARFSLTAVTVVATGSFAVTKIALWSRHQEWIVSLHW